MLKRMHLFLAFAASHVCTAAFADGDAAQGAVDFRARCASCHASTSGQNGVGPYLFGIIGRVRGGAIGYNYSPMFQAAKEKGEPWSEEELFNYLFDPADYIRKLTGQPNGTIKMTTKYKDAQVRRNIIAYLSTLK